MGSASAAATLWAFSVGSWRIGTVGCLWVALHLFLARHLARRPDRAIASDRVLRKLGPAGLLGGLWTAAPAIVGTTLLVSIGPISDRLHADPLLGVALYLAGFVLLGGAGLLPSSAQAVLAGWVFGPVYGFVAALALATLGFVGASAVGYGIARRVSGDRVESLFAERPRWDAVRRALVDQRFWKSTLVVTLVRLPRTSPFSLTNLVLAASGVRLPAYLLGTALGMLPRTAIPVWLAWQASSTGARDIQAFLSEGSSWPLVVVGIVAMIVLFSLIGRAARRGLDHVTQEA